MWTKTKRFNLAVTTGDEDGIGFEVAAKALLRTPDPTARRFVFIPSTQSTWRRDLLRKLDRKFSTVHTNDQDWRDLLSKNNFDLVFIHSKEAPPFWVQTSATACMGGHFNALATAPLSKTLIQSCGLRDIGHTDILKRISGAKFLNMAFLGEKFNVVLATGHVPLKKVAATLTADCLRHTLHNTMELRRHLGRPWSRLPIAVLGLNPHAGESGLLGQEENAIVEPVLKAFKSKRVVGPLVPDAAFRAGAEQRYAAYVCLYHDQGLIPFKAIHGYNSAHVTLGLPFVRTSVDHGTAKDIYGQDKAQWQSMQQALLWARKIRRTK